MAFKAKTFDYTAFAIPGSTNLTDKQILHMSFSVFTSITFLNKFAHFPKEWRLLKNAKKMSQAKLLKQGNFSYTNFLVPHN